MNGTQKRRRYHELAVEICHRARQEADVVHYASVRLSDDFDKRELSLFLCLCPKCMKPSIRWRAIIEDTDGVTKIAGNGCIGRDVNRRMNRLIDWMNGYGSLPKSKETP